MKTMLNIKMESKLKRELKKTADTMGLPVSALINNAARRIVAEQLVVFQTPLVPNEKTGKFLKKALKDIKARKNLSPIFETMEEMISYLNKGQ